jgi:hypothetical protein
LVTAPGSDPKALATELIARLSARFPVVEKELAKRAR